MFSKINSVGLFGLNAFPVTVEASFSAGQPNFDIVGNARYCGAGEQGEDTRGSGTA